jgi:phosphatidylglycerophosphatase A
MVKIFTFFGTFAGCGLLPIAPGTWASLFVTLIYFFWKPNITQSLISLALTLVVSVPASYFTEKHYRRKDPTQCVIDEVVGQQVTLLFWLPFKGYFFAAFMLFRVFDIIKPFPVKSSERIPYGFGIVADDLLAGLYALGTLKLLSLVFWS